MQYGKSIDEIQIGEKASLTRTFTDEDVRLFAELSGDRTPYHLDDEIAQASIFGARIVHGMLTASLVPAVCSAYLPGPGTFGIDIYAKLVAPVYIGDTVTAGVEVVEKNEAKNRIKVKINFVNQHGKQVLVGHSWCVPPLRSQSQ